MMMSNGLQDSVEEFLARFRAARDAGNARAYAAEFTEDATYVIFLGEVLIGREEIERNHVDVFERWQKGTKMAVKAIGIRSISADVCSVLTIGGIGGQPPIAYDKIQTFTLVRLGDRWLCAAFQNTAMSRQTKSTYNQNFESRT
jgi:uncharacterized protein (TIGR02246 family)